MTIQQLSPELLSPNDYNPNKMTDDEFAELDHVELAAAIVDTLKGYVTGCADVEMTEKDKAATIKTLALLPRIQLRGLFDLAECRAIVRIGSEIIGGKK